MLYFSNYSDKPLMDTCIRRNIFHPWLSLREQITIPKYGFCCLLLTIVPSYSGTSAQIPIVEVRLVPDFPGMMLMLRG